MLYLAAKLEYFLNISPKHGLSGEITESLELYEQTIYKQ